jgi:hypothetical protein
MDHLEIPRTETKYYHDTRLAINFKMFFATPFRRETLIDD